MKPIGECTDGELGLIAYKNIKVIARLQAENRAIDVELDRRSELKPKGVADGVDSTEN